MGFTENYEKKRIRKKSFIKKMENNYLDAYLHRMGWIDTDVGGNMIYSHRNTYYTPATFTEGLHAHEYYELLIYMGGDIEYIKENTRLIPTHMSVIWFKPGQMHTARLLSSSYYERYVLLFTEDFFKFDDKISPILEFMTSTDNFALKIPEKKISDMLGTLKKADRVLSAGKPYSALLLKSYLTELFDILNYPNMQVEKGEDEVDIMLQIKMYIDNEYASITSIADIAKKFFYTREHLSRKFRKAFNISISHYLSKRRIMESLPMLSTMNIANVAYAVGFHSQSTYISAFKENMGCLPSEYKARCT